MAEGSITTTVEVMGEEEEGVSTTTDLRPLSVGVPRPTPRPPTDRPLPPSGAATTATGAATDAGRTPGRGEIQFCAMCKKKPYFLMFPNIHALKICNMTSESFIEMGRYQNFNRSRYLNFCVNRYRYWNFQKKIIVGSVRNLYFRCAQVTQAFK